jgi:hypothetical protein
VTATITSTSAKTSTKHSNASEQSSLDRSLIVASTVNGQALSPAESYSSHHHHSPNSTNTVATHQRSEQEAEYEQHKRNVVTRTTRTQQDTIRLTATISNRGGVEKLQGVNAITGEQVSAKHLPSITISTDKKSNVHRINIRSRSNSSEAHPSQPPPPPLVNSSCCGGNSNGSSTSSSVVVRNEVIGPSLLRHERGGEGNSMVMMQYHHQQHQFHHQNIHHQQQQQTYGDCSGGHGDEANNYIDEIERGVEDAGCNMIDLESVASQIAPQQSGCCVDSLIPDYCNEDEAVLLNTSFTTSASGISGNSNKNIAHIDVKNDVPSLNTSVASSASGHCGAEGIKFEITTVYNKDGELIEKTVYEK